jgi:hypothetical protein
MLHILSVCVCVFVALHATNTHNETCNAHAPYCHLWSARLYSMFLHCLIKGMICDIKVTEHNMCVLIFSTISVCNISHSKKKWARYDKNVTRSLWQTWIFFTDFFFLENTQISNYMKIVQWEQSCSMRTDGRTDKTKLIVAFRNFEKAPKNYPRLYSTYINL